LKSRKNVLGKYLKHQKEMVFLVESVMALGEVKKDGIKDIGVIAVGN